MNRSKVVAFALGPVGAGLFGFVTLPLLAWVFPAADVGRLSMLQVAVALGSVFFSLGLDQAYAREFHEVDDVSTLLRAALLLVMVALLLGTAVLYCASPGLISKALFGIDSGRLSLYVIGCLVVTLLVRFLAVTLRMREKGLAYSLTQIAPKLFFLVFVVLALAIGLEKSFGVILVAQLAGLLFTLVLAIWLARYDCIQALRAKTDRRQAQMMLKFGVPLIVGGMMAWALFAMDRVMLRSLAGYDELAVYSVAASMASGVTLFAGVFTTIWWPQVYKWAAEGADSTVINTVADQVLAACVVLFGMVGLCSRLLYFVLPIGYNRVPCLFVGCVAAPIFYLLSEVTVVGINISRRTTYAMLASATAGVLNLIGNYVMVPRLGAEGAVLATMTAFFVFLVFRTELSIFLWHKISRFKMYFWAAMMLGGAAMYEHAGARWPWMSLGGWLIFSLIATYHFRMQLLGIYRFARHGIGMRTLVEVRSS
jgi:O-antigen/teichoic acid export membrane protein